MIVKCKECGTKIDVDESIYEIGIESSTICPLCGETVLFTIPKPVAKPIKPQRPQALHSNNRGNKYCSECGIAIEEDIKFCPNCGQRIETDDDIIGSQVDPNNQATTSHNREEQHATEIPPENVSIQQVPNSSTGKTGIVIIIIIALLALIAGIVFWVYNTKYNASDNKTDFTTDQQTTTTQSTTNYSSVVITVDDLRLRMGPSTNYDCLQFYDDYNVHPHKGDILEYLGEYGDFYKVNFEGNIVYVSKDYAYLSNNTPYIHPNTLVLITGKNVNLRLGPEYNHDYARDNSGKVIQLKKRSKYTYIRSEGDYYVIDYYGYHAYVSKYYAHPI